jgi:hypothetical protein
LRLLLAALLLSQMACAAGFTASYDSNLSAVMVKVHAALQPNTTTEAGYEAFLENHTVLVMGSRIDLAERLLLETAKSQNAWLARVREANDSAATLQDIDEGRYSLVIMIGGPEQNNITRELQGRGSLNESQNVEAGMVVLDGKLPGDGVALAITDRKGLVADLESTSVDSSPLLAIVPRELVPATATGISVILLALANVARTVFEFKALDFGRKGKKVGQGAFMAGGLNLTEMLAIFGASMILGVSISWQYLRPGTDFFWFLAVNSLVCLGAAILHEVTHRIFAHIFRIKMEYRFWPAGSFLTLLSSYLGNAFSIQGFILEEIPPDTPKWKVGLTKLAAPLVSAIVMIGFALLNYASPDPVYKIIYSTSALWAMAEILPFGALDGKDVKDWNRDVWYLAFFFIGASYFVVTFLL